MLQAEGRELRAERPAAIEQRPGSPEAWASIMRRQMEETKKKHGPLDRQKLNSLRMSGAVSVYVYEFLWRELFSDA